MNNYHKCCATKTNPPYQIIFKPFYSYSSYDYETYGLRENSSRTENDDVETTLFDESPTRRLFK